VNNKKNILFFFTADFPFGNQEAFLENEITILSKNFDRIVIISGANDLSFERSLPKTVEVKNIPYENTFTFFQKILAFCNLRLYKEFFLMLFFYKRLPNYGRVKTVLRSYLNSSILEVIYNSEISKYSSYKKYLYSFWFNDSTISMGLLKKKNKEITTLSRAHRWDLYFEENKYNYLPFRKQTTSYLDSIYSASEEGIEYCKNYWKISNSKKLKLARLGVKNQKFLPLVFNQKVIVSCSNLYSWKRVDKIISALSHLKNKNIEWYHFGDGPEYRKVLSLAKKLLNENIYFKFLGRVDNNTLLDWYKKKNPSIFINLSSSEGVPVSIMEAMSFGIPCVATNVGGCGELVTRNSGFPVDVNLSNKEIAKIIDDFLNLKVEKQEEKRKNAYNHIIDEFNAEKNYTLFCSDVLAH
jgi:colanic acid/amylovoran biosynthesis glycosyltransferase